MIKESAKTEINKQDSKRKQELEKQITEVNKALQEGRNEKRFKENG